MFIIRCFIFIRLTFDELHLSIIDCSRHFPNSSPLLVIVGETRKDGSQDAGGVGEHDAAGEADELADPRDGHHLQLDVGRLRVGDEDVDHPGEVHHLGLVLDVTQELAQKIITVSGYVRTLIIQNMEQRIQELWQMFDHLGVRNTVQQTYPRDEKLSAKRNDL